MCSSQFTFHKMSRRIAMWRNALMMFGFVLLTLALMVPPDATAANSCQPLEDAIAKLATTPTHIYSAVSDGLDSKPTAIEMIYVGGAVYLKVGDKWERTKFTTQELTHQSLEKQRQDSCQYQRDESVSGQPTAKYTTQSQSGEARALLMISRRKCRPLRAHVDVHSRPK